LRSKPLAGRNAKNPDGTSRCNAAGRSPWTSTAGDEPVGGLAKDTEQLCPGRGAHERFKAVRGTNGEARRESPSNASQREQPGRARRTVVRRHVVEVAEARMRRDGRRLVDCCGRSSTPEDNSSLQARPAFRSPRYQRSSHGRDFTARDGTIAAAVETVGDASGENEELIRPEHAIFSPHRKWPACAVKVWRRRRDRATIDDEQRSGCIDSITGTRGDGFEDVPILTVSAGTRQDILLRTTRNTEINDSPHGGLDCASDVQARRDTRRCVDDNDAMAEKGWKDRPHNH
jgi:hypothetical protein